MHSGAPATRLRAPAGVVLVLMGALLLQFASALVVRGGGLNSTWDSWVAFVIPALALPAAVLWWTRSPAGALRMLPLLVGIALVPSAVLELMPPVAASLPDVVVTVAVMLASAAFWAAGGLVLIGAASLAAAGRVVAAGLICALLVLCRLLLPTVFVAMRAVDLPTFLYPVLLLMVAGLLMAGGSMLLRHDRGRPAVSAATALSAGIGALALLAPSLTSYFALSLGGLRSTSGWFTGVAAAMVIAAIVGAVLLGREALLLVLGAGLVLGCLYSLTSSVSAGLGSNWWLPVLAIIVLLASAAVAAARSAREIGMSFIGLLVIVLVATFLAVRSGGLDDGLEIALTLAGLVAGAMAGGSIVGAAVQRLVRTDDVVPVVLLTLALGAGAAQLLAALLAAIDVTRNTSLLWICGVLVLTVAAIARWPRSRGGAPRNTPIARSAGPVSPDQPAHR